MGQWYLLRLTAHQKWFTEVKTTVLVIPFQSNSPIEVIYWGKTTGLVIPFQSNSPLEVIYWGKTTGL
jgi:hypothetical protein